MRLLIKKVYIPFIYDSKTRMAFVMDSLMETYIMSQSALALPVFLNLMLKAYENGERLIMYCYAVVWMVMGVVFLYLRYRFDILVNGRFYYSILEEVRAKCITNVYNSNEIQIDEDYSGSGLYTLLVDELRKLVGSLFDFNRIKADVLIIIGFGIWTINVGKCLAIIIMVGAVATAVTSNKFSKRINLQNESLYELRTRIVERLKSIFLGTEDYLLMGQYNKIVKKYNSEENDYIFLNKVLAKSKAHKAIYIKIIDFVTYIFLIGGCYFLVEKNRISITITMVSAYETMKTYMSRIAANISGVTENRYVAEKYKSLVSAEKKESLENTGDYIIEASDVSYIVNNVYIIENMSFKMEKNTRVAIIGKNGSGKSTFLKILLSQLQPTKGAIRRNKEYSYSYIPSSSQLFPVSIETNISYGCVYENGSLKKYESDADLLKLGQERLESVLHEGDEDLSGGEAQRVAIARALAAESDVIIADEPTASLDIVTAGKVFNNLMNASKNLLYITHDPELLKYADIIVIIDRGKIVSCGTYEEIIKLDIYNEWKAEACQRNQGI